MTETATDGNRDVVYRRLTSTVNPTNEDAVVSQKRLILKYTKNQLWPHNMGGAMSIESPP